MPREQRVDSFRGRSRVCCASGGAEVVDNSAPESGMLRTERQLLLFDRRSGQSAFSVRWDALPLLVVEKASCGPFRPWWVDVLIIGQCVSEEALFGRGKGITNVPARFRTDGERCGMETLCFGVMPEMLERVRLRAA